jgi:hypothetical protein
MYVQFNNIPDVVGKLHASDVLHRYTSADTRWQGMRLGLSEEGGGAQAASERATYASVLQKYALLVGEHGYIDTLRTKEAVSFNDYIPGLTNIATFARILSVVPPEQVQNWILFDTAGWFILN